MNISRNSLIQWNEDPLRLERLLHIDFCANWASVYPMPVNSKKPVGMPYDMEAQFIKASIENGVAQLVLEDPYGRHITKEQDPENSDREMGDTETNDIDTNALVPRLLWKEEELPKKHRKKRNKVWRVLGRYMRGLRILDREERGKIIDEIIEKHKWTKPVVYKYLHRYWQSGQVKNAFLPLHERCGGKGKTRLRSEKEERKEKWVKRGRPSALSRATKEPTGTNMTVEMRDKTLRGLRKIFVKHKGISFAEAFRKLTEQYFTAGAYRLQNGVLIPILLPPSKRPTKGQARYWYHHSDRWLTDLPKRVGQRTINLKYRGMTGNPTKQAFGPGSCFQIDSTVADIYLVSQICRRHIIGRPIIYVVIDVFSHLIVGFYIGLRPASWRSAIAALRNATEDKTKYCESIGLSIPITEEEWPCHYLPEAVCADRGKEYLGNASEDLVNGLNIRMDNTASFRADWKGLVERQFKLIDERGVYWAPGAVRIDRKLFGEDYRLDAKLTLAECRQLFAHLCYQHNNIHPIKDYPYDEFMIEDDVPPYPVDLWHWGIRNRSHVREVSPKLMPHLLPSEEARVTANGIIFQHLSYTCPAAIKGRWFDKARVRGTSTIRVNFNEENTNIIFARLPNGRLERCYLLDRHNAFADRHWDDVLDYFAIKKQDSERARPKREQRLVESRSHVDHIINTAIEETDKIPVTESKSARTTGIQKNRIAEARRDRKRPHVQEIEADADIDHIEEPDFSDVIAKTFKRKMND